MKKILKFVSLILFLCADHQALAIQTQINEVTDLFDKHIEDKDSLLQNMKKQNDNAMEQIKSRKHHESIEGMDGAEGKANELNSIKETDLDEAGRQKRGSQEYQFYDENELEPDYTKPGNLLHKLDSDDIVTSTEKTMRQIGTDLMKRLIELGFNCKTVKGAIHKDPTYYIDIKKEDQKNTEYDQFFCEEPRGQYNCTDTATLQCVRTGVRYNNWQDRTIEFSGHEVYWEHNWWMVGIKWKAKRFGIHMKIGNQNVNNDVRGYIAKKLGVNIDQINEYVGIDARGVGNIFHVEGKSYTWEKFIFKYKYRDSYQVCEQWAEDWTERCMLK